MFEHVDNPFKSALNLKKILAEDGLIFFTVPFMARYHYGHGNELAHPHTPLDQYRYSIQGVRKLWAEAGGIHIVEEYASGHSLLTHAYLDGFGTNDFTEAELEKVLFDARTISVGGTHGEEDLYYNVNVLLEKTTSPAS